MVTQVEIAKRVGLDVSSVNKILGGDPRPSFHKDTVARVVRIAKKLGYNFSRDTKHSLRRENAEFKAAMSDLYDGYRFAGGWNLKPETIATLRRHFPGAPETKREIG